MNNLERARHLRDSAARCMRLSKGVGNQEDEALLEALAAEWDQAAAEIESAAADPFGSPLRTSYKAKKRMARHGRSRRGSVRDDGDIHMPN